MSSIDINTTIAFLRVSTPNTPARNIKPLNIKKYSIGIFIITQISFFAKTRAPIVAARSKNPAASKGIIYFVKINVPIFSIVPACTLALHHCLMQHLKVLQKQ